MMRSMFSGVSGLRNHQTMLDIVGNNIANVNTVGFKASQLSFQDALCQTIRGGQILRGEHGRDKSHPDRIRSQTGLDQHELLPGILAEHGTNDRPLHPG